MAYLNQFIMIVMMIFMGIAALDRILDQYGGSAKILNPLLPKLGDQIEGAGKQFEEGFMAMGALGLAMIGVIALAPVMAKVFGFIVIPLYEMMGANPAMFATTLIANDMGGFFLARELSNGDVAAWLYAGLILGAMMGPTIAFSIPFAIGIVKKEDRPFLAKGILLGLVTIPVGCLAGGMLAMVSGVTVEGQPVQFTMSMLVINLIPVILISGLIVLGLWRIPEKMINGFQIFAKILVTIITIGLACAALQAILGFSLIPGMSPIFKGIDDADMRAVEVVGYIACVLLGAYPMVFLLTRWFEKPLTRFSGKLNINATSAAGMIASLANNIPMFGLFSKMDDRGKVINAAFTVSAAFTFGDHLAFTAGVVPGMIMPVIVGKLIGGISAVMLALVFAPKAKPVAEIIEAEASVIEAAQ